MKKNFVYIKQQINRKPVVDRRWFARTCHEVLQFIAKKASKNG